MGYYTDFEIYFYDKNGKSIKKKQYEDIITNLKKEFDFLEEMDEESNGFYINAKWYRFEEDLEKFSKKYCPDILIEIKGQGEEPDDKWKHYIINGKHLHAEAVFTYPAIHNMTLENISNEILSVNSKKTSNSKIWKLNKEDN